MRYSYIVEKRITAVDFGFFDQDEIYKMSVANLTSERIYDEQTFLPNMNAVNDPRMGACTKDLEC
jgi:DNA-directed RNA polymerase beta' subunit